jgi:hypothetical protein
VRDASRGGDEPPRVGLGFKFQAGLPTLLEASLQPSVVGLDDGVPDEVRVVPSSASALGRGELSGVSLGFCHESLAVTVDRSSQPETLCSPAASAKRCALARRVVHRLSSARGAAHTGRAGLGTGRLVRGARASAQGEVSSQYQAGAAAS